MTTRGIRAAAVAVALCLAAPLSGLAGAVPPVPAGLTVEVTVTPNLSATATIVVAAVRIRDTDGHYSEITVSWGDGGFEGHGRHLSCAETGPPRPTDATLKFDHAYRLPGVYSVAVHVKTETCSGGEFEEGAAATAVAITPGGMPSNGPRRPGVYPGEYFPPKGGDRRTTYGLFGASDEDGYVSRVLVDWGDGTAPRAFAFPLSDCKDPITTWPSSRRGELRQTHRYRRPGRYRITATVTSTGCDGQHAQTRTATYIVKSPSTF